MGDHPTTPISKLFVLRYRITRNTFRLEPELGSAQREEEQSRARWCALVIPALQGWGRTTSSRAAKATEEAGGGGQRREREERKKRRGRERREEGTKGVILKRKTWKTEPLLSLLPSSYPCNILHVTSQYPFFLCIEKILVPFQVSQAKRQSPVSVWSGIPVPRSRACSTWASSL